MTSNTKPYFHATGVITMLENKYKRLWAIYSPLKSVYVVDGEEIPSAIFEAQYPLELQTNAIDKGENPNGRVID